MTKQIILKDETEITDCSYGEFSRFPLRWDTDTASFGDTPLWLVLDECGHWMVPVAVVGGGTMDEAIEAATECLPAINDPGVIGYDPDDEAYAYGFDTTDEFRAALDAAENGDGEWPEACGHTHNGNGGLVHTEGLRFLRLTKEAMDAHGIELQIRSYGAAEDEKGEIEPDPGAMVAGCEEYCAGYAQCW